MNPALRLLSEYFNLARTLNPQNFVLLLKETVLNAHSILSSKKLTIVGCGDEQRYDGALWQFAPYGSASADGPDSCCT